ncbi:M10 family metallopeptidase [Microvirga terricola]|uniref:Peptidase M10 serralysin C-terminal domain-containing protein n=1 Tax=Microvirga terricola TaxID=2719797 RepID=A0ABX0VAM5_9HYPH|nr:M10 family metallopeptidase [Microvirga terricola]NIX76753.1 hypothetical protein [Microvirga terricola]
MATIRTSVPGSAYGSAYTDALIWGGTAWDVTGGPIKVYFGEGSDYGRAITAHGSSGYLRNADAPQSWNPTERNAFAYALSVVSSVCGLTFTAAASVAEANIVWWKTDMGGGILGAHEIPAATQIWGYFNPTFTWSWSNLGIGGDGLYTIIHELGHGLGLAHPHDGGVQPDATHFPGVVTSDDVGTFGLNQGPWTVMSYNSGWDQAPRSPSFGAQGALGAFDIAALQALYGENTSTATGNNTYILPTRNAVGTGWMSVWDTGGIDAINGYKATSGVVIDLRPASLVAGDPGAGGYVSRQWDIGGGFTIAHGVTIENAYGSRLGDDLLTGNDVANILRGYSGDDILRGLGGNDLLQGGSGEDRLLGYDGNDTLWGGSGCDVMAGGAGRDVFVFNTKPSVFYNRDKISDFNVKGDTIWLDKAIFKALKAGKLAKSAFWIGDKAHDSNDRIIYDNKKGVLFYDADGTGLGAPVQFAVLSKHLKMTAADFFVI